MQLRLEKAIYGGACLARHDGRAMFVPYTLPGELVEARIAREQKGFAECEAVQVLEPAAPRVEPDCRYFGACGGCHYQHADYAAQLDMKKRILAETLVRAGVRELPEPEVLYAEPWQYRNRIRFAVTALPAGLSVGYRGQHSHQVVAVDECPVAGGVLETLASRLPLLLAQLPAAYRVKEIELFENHDSSQLGVALFGTGRLSGQETKLWSELLARQVQQLHHVFVYETGTVPKARGRRARPDQAEPKLVASWVRTGLHSGSRSGVEPFLYSVNGIDLACGVDAFFQVNRRLVDRMAQLATGGRTGRVAWDLYAGVGLFSTALARQFQKVVAVEGSPASAAYLRRNLAGTGADAVCESTLNFLRARRTTDRPDLIVVDPPRAGLGETVAGLLGGVGAHELTYVSCDPATLGRDLVHLLQFGYSIHRLTLLDLFPQTFHMEAVVQLRAKDGDTRA